MVGIDFVQSRIAHLFGNIHHHGVEGFSGILDTLFFLMAGAPTANGAQSKDSVAVRTIFLFEYDDFLAPACFAAIAVTRPAGPAPKMMAS